MRSMKHVGTDATLERPLSRALTARGSLHHLG